MDNLKDIYEKYQLRCKMEKILNISKLTCELFDNIELQNIIFLNGPYKDENIYKYLNKYFNYCALFPTSIFCRIIDSLNNYYKKTPNNEIINKYIEDIKLI